MVIKGEAQVVHPPVSVSRLLLLPAGSLVGSNLTELLKDSIFYKCADHARQELM